MSYLAKFAYWEACWLTFEVLYLTTGNFALEWISTVSLCTWIVCDITVNCAYVQHLIWTVCLLVFVVENGYSWPLNTH